MIRQLASLLAGAALACAVAFPAVATQRTGGCGDKFIAPPAASYAATVADDGTLISPTNATGPAAGWGAASLPVALPSIAAIANHPWTICGTSENNRAVIFTAPTLAAPSAPALSQTTGGSLPARTYVVSVTYTNLVGETVASADATLAVGVNSRLVVGSPASSSNATGWNLYIGTTSGNKTRQNAAPLTLGSNFTEPLGGLVAGAPPPSTNTAPAAYIIDGGRVLLSYLIGGSNYQTATLSSDGSNYRVVSASTETRLHNGATSGYPARTLFPGGPGYQATQADNGYVITSGATAGGLTVTLPPTTAIAAGWTVRFNRDGGRLMIVQTNATSGGAIAFPGGTTNSLELAPHNYEFVELQYDGAVYRVVAISPATAGLIGVSGAFVHVPTNAALKLIRGTPGNMAFREGFYAAGDGGRATYAWSPINCTNADDGGQVQPTTGTGCWVADFSTREVDPRVWGLVCGTANDGTAVMRAVEAYLYRTGGGFIALPCPTTLSGKLTLRDKVGLRGTNPIFYPGMVNRAPDGSMAWADWPPASGSVINCTSITEECVKVAGLGVEVAHIDFGNPQPEPPLTADTPWTPTLFPFILSTDPLSSWNGLHIHHLTFTSAAQCINLNGTPDYTTAGIAGAQWTVSDIWFNPCFYTGMRLKNLDNTGRVHNIDYDFWWRRHSPAVGRAVKLTGIGMLLEFAANTQFTNIEFYALKIAMLFNDSTVDYGDFVKTLAAVNIQGSNIDFNLVCQAMKVENSATRVSGIFTNIIAHEDNIYCGTEQAFFDLSSDNVDFSFGHVRGGEFDSIMAIGGPNGGNVYINDINAVYSVFTTGRDAFRVSSAAYFTLAADVARIVPANASAGYIIGPGLDTTQGYMRPRCVGGGARSIDGAACLQSSGAPDITGSVAFYTPDGVQQGFVGAASTGGVNINAIGGVYLNAGNLANSFVVNANGSLTIPIKNTVSLPTCNEGQRGAIFMVNDAATPTYLGAYVSGGSSHVMIFCDGLAWRTM